MWFGLEDYEHGDKIYDDGYHAEIDVYGEESRDNGNYSATLTMPDGTRWRQYFANTSAQMVRDIVERAVVSDRTSGGQPTGFGLF